MLQALKIRKKLVGASCGPLYTGEMHKSRRGKTLVLLRVSYGPEKVLKLFANTSQSSQYIILFHQRYKRSNDPLFIVSDDH